MILIKQDSWIRKISVWEKMWMLFFSNLCWLYMSLSSLIMVFKDKQVEETVIAFGTNTAYFSALLSKLCVFEKEIKSCLYFLMYYYFFIYSSAGADFQHFVYTPLSLDFNALDNPRSLSRTNYVTIKDKSTIRYTTGQQQVFGLCHSDSWERRIQYASVPQPSYSLLTFSFNLQSYSILGLGLVFFSPADYFSPNQRYYKSSRSYSSATSLTKMWIKSAAMLMYAFKIVLHTFFSVNTMPTP